MTQKKTSYVVTLKRGASVTSPRGFSVKANGRLLRVTEDHREYDWLKRHPNITLSSGAAAKPVPKGGRARARAQAQQRAVVDERRPGEASTPEKVSSIFKDAKATPKAPSAATAAAERRVAAVVAAAAAAEALSEAREEQMTYLETVISGLGVPGEIKHLEGNLYSLYLEVDNNGEGEGEGEMETVKVDFDNDLPSALDLAAIIGEQIFDDEDEGEAGENADPPEDVQDADPPEDVQDEATTNAEVEDPNPDNFAGDELRALADQLEVKWPRNITDKTLRKKIKAHLASTA